MFQKAGRISVVAWLAGTILVEDHLRTTKVWLQSAQMFRYKEYHIAGYFRQCKFWRFQGEKI